MTSHTPGPWVYDMRDDGSMEVHNIDYSVFITKRHPMNDRDEAVANANLIAAAPALLAALEAAERSLAWACAAFADIPADCTFRDSLTEARAAIAAAHEEGL